MSQQVTDEWFRYLHEKTFIDQRIYKVQLGCVLNLDITGADTQIENQIRGITAVTTVKHVSDKQRKYSLNTVFRIYEIKYEIEGSYSREKFRDKVLIPEMEKQIKSLKVVKKGRPERVDSLRTRPKNINERYGSPASSLPYNDSQIMPQAPALTIDAVLKDWMDGSVQAYDVPMNTDNMAYHVMVPVEELWPLCGRYYRGSKEDFDVRYRSFIKDGATSPVYVALGKNGRVKLTGNEDAVWFAKKSGLKELPVFFSYQRQV